MEKLPGSAHYVLAADVRQVSVLGQLRIDVPCDHSAHVSEANTPPIRLSCGTADWSIDCTHAANIRALVSYSTSDGSPRAFRAASPPARTTSGTRKI